MVIEARWLYTSGRANKWSENGLLLNKQLLNLISASFRGIFYFIFQSEEQRLGLQSSQGVHKRWFNEEWGAYRTVYSKLSVPNPDPATIDRGDDDDATLIHTRVKFGPIVTGEIIYLIW